MYIKFKNTHSFEGTDYEGVDINLDSLKGSDIEKAQEIMAVERRSGGNNLPEFSKAYCAQVAALAAKLPSEFFRSLPVREYVRITLEVQNFLLDGASEMANTQ